MNNYLKYALLVTGIVAVIAFFGSTMGNTVQAVGAFACTPAHQNVKVGELAKFSVVNGNGHGYHWSAPNGNPNSGTGTHFSTSYAHAGTYTVTATEANHSAQCIVNVHAPAFTHTPTPTPTPNQTPTLHPSIGINKTVRNVSQNGAEQAGIIARPNETVEFALQIRNTGNTILDNTYVLDVLPSGMIYSGNTSTLDGSFLRDGVTTGGLDIGTLTAHPAPQP